MKSIRDKILDRYLKVCHDAVKDDKVFATFKSHRDYHEVLEHCPINIANNHWDNIRHDYFTGEAMLKFLTNDDYGKPPLSSFGQFTASPTTIQYISVLSNLITRFGSLQGFDVVAIGDGYGGQAKIIQDMFDIKSYTSIDLEECVHLQKKYLSKFGYGLKMRFYTNHKHKYSGEKWDLFLSNYALTEVSQEDQLNYVKDIVIHCGYGYITANQPLNGLDLLQQKYDVKIDKDIAGERDTNFLITW